MEINTYIYKHCTCIYIYIYTYIYLILRISDFNGKYFADGQGKLLGFINCDIREFFNQKLCNNPSAYGPICIHINKVAPFKKFVDFKWVQGPQRYLSWTPELFQTIVKENMESLIRINSWIAKEPQKYCQIKKYTDITILVIKTPFAQATIKGLKTIENVSKQTNTHIDRKKDAPLPNKVFCRQELQPAKYKIYNQATSNKFKCKCSK